MYTLNYIHTFTHTRKKNIYKNFKKKTALNTQVVLSDTKEKKQKQTKKTKQKKSLTK